MQTLMKDRNLGLFMLVTNHAATDGQYGKELMLFSDESILAEEESKVLELIDVLGGDKEYQLSQMTNHLDDGAPGSLVTWTVGNLKMSRKNLEKLLKTFYNY